jgi:hypothetical protein
MQNYKIYVWKIVVLHSEEVPKLGFAFFFFLGLAGAVDIRTAQY